MSVTVVGSIALDTVETPAGRNEEELGGAATYFALAAATYTEVHLVGVVGEDFPREYIALLEGRRINLDGLTRVPGKTFRWVGRYHSDPNVRDTLKTELNVFADFHPRLPEAARVSKYLFLGNIHPALQFEVLEQARAAFVGLDTMNLWITTARAALLEVLKRVDVVMVNDEEARQLTGEPNLIKAVRAMAALGPKTVVVKKGEHGCLLAQRHQLFGVPAFPLHSVVDPTGAGDSFAGGFMGYLAQQNRTDFEAMRQAAVHGSLVASFACEDFGPGGVSRLDDKALFQRLAEFRRFAQF